MLRDAAVAQVKIHLGFKQGTAIDADIVTQFQQLQDDLENSSELPFFLRKAWHPNTMTANVASTAVPADFIRDDDENLLTVLNSENKEFPLYKDTTSFLKVRYPSDTEKQIPKAYARVYKTIYWYPTPDQNYLIQGFYYGKEPVLSSNIENLWMKELPYLFIARAGLNLGSGFRDKNALLVLSTMNEIHTNKLIRMSVADDMAGKKLVIGGED